MSFFTTPLSQLGTAHLQELLAIPAVENVRLEFKREVPDKDEMLKKLSSFANTFGGYVVIGATANSADGRIQDLPGVDPQSGYKQKIVQWSFDAASPPLTVEVSDPISIPANNGKVCYVVYVAESDLAPHFLNGRKGVWIRTDEFSQRFEARLADESELRHLFDRRRLVRERRARLLERATKRFDTFVARPDRSGNKTNPGPSLALCIVPRFPSTQLCGQEKLKNKIRDSDSFVRWRGSLFPDPGSPILSQHESAIIIAPRTHLRNASIFEVNIWGMVFYGALISGDHDGTIGIHLYQFVGHILLYLRHAANLLQRLEYSGPIHIDIALRSILGVPWLEGWDFRSVGRPTSELDDEVRFSIPTTCEALLQKPNGVAMEILRWILFSVGLANMVESDDALKFVIQQGYAFNSWPVTELLL
jgi:hypothetical protein